MLSKLRATSIAAILSVFLVLIGLGTANAVTFVTTSLPNAIQGQPYAVDIVATNGKAPYACTTPAWRLPAGLTLSSDCHLTGVTNVAPARYAPVITVKDAVGASASATLNLYVVIPPPPPPVSVSITPTTSSLFSGDSQQFTASVSNTSNTAVSWSSSVGTISANGLFTAPTVSSSTSVTVTATSNADTTKTSVADVTVNPLPTVSVSISPASVSLKPGDTQQFDAVVSGPSNTAVTWSATGGIVDPNGSYTAPNVTVDSTFTVTATSVADSTKSDSAVVTVTVPPQPPQPPQPPPNPPPATGFDGPAELPRVYMQTALANTPAPGIVIPVAAGGNVQAALNSANCGDTITLAAGTSYSGKYTFPAKPCDDQHWIIVRTSAPDSALPPEGSRMLPCYAGVASLPGRPGFSCPSLQNVLAQIIFPTPNFTGPIAWAAGANHYRFIGLEITRAVGTGIDYSLVSPAPNATADHIILDRVWLHGVPQDETKVGFTVSGLSYAALIDSYTSDLHCTATTGLCTDAQVVSGGLGSANDSVHKITGNFLESSGENILYGGGSATTTPTDIEIRQNHFFKPLTWLAGQPGFIQSADGHPFMVKNHFELKNAIRVLFEDNILEDTWGGFSQSGFSILLSPKNQGTTTPGQGLCPICAVADVTIRNSTISHVGAGFQIFDGNTSGGSAALGERYSIHDVTIDDINAGKFKGNGTLFQISNSWAVNGLKDVMINHVTSPSPTSVVISLGNDTSDPKMPNFTFTNNIIGQVPYPIWSTGGGTANCAYYDVPLTSLDACFSPYTFTNNAFIAMSGNFPPSKWPTGNLFPATASAVGFVNFNNANGGDYHLLPSSPYKNAGSDGKDIGADIDAIQNAIAGVY